MRNKGFCSFLLLLFISAISGYAGNINMSKATKNSFIITQTSNQNVQYATCSIGRITTKEQSTAQGTFVLLESEGMTNSGIVGQPELPSFSELIEIPQKATVKVSVVSYTEETIALNSKTANKKVIPYQGATSKSQEKTFAYNKSTYSKNAFLNTQKAKFEICGTMRDTRFGRLVLNPIQYNPSTNTLKVLNNLKVKIEFVNADYNATAEIKSKAGNVYMNGLTSAFISSNLKTASLRAGSTYTKETMIIVANEMFKNDLTTFIAHKKRMGLNIIEHYVSTSASNDYIKGLISSDYNNPPSGYRKPLYLLLVGDVDQLKSWEVSEDFYSDLNYATMDSNDYIPDLFYGRLSANNRNELWNQIEKIIEYESYSMPDPSYLYNATLLAGWSGDGNWQEANSQMIYAKNKYCNAQNHIQAHSLLQNENGPIIHTSEFINKVNNGCGLVNYSGHGCSTCLGSQFSTSNISQLHNEHKYGLWIANACKTCKFDEQECLGEALVRASKKGAVGYIGASNKSHWKSDYYWAVGYRSNTYSVSPSFNANYIGMYDKLFHTNGIANRDKFSTQGAIIYAGNLSVERVGANKYYWQIYHLMGDPSVNVRFTPPTECDEDMTVAYEINDGQIHDEFIANRSIIASNKITNNSNVHFAANYSIRLTNGFKASAGSKLKIDLYGCSEGNINALRRGMYTSEEYTSDEEESDDVYKTTDDEPIALYPNPTEGIFSIQFGEEEGKKDVTITNISGKTIYANSFDGSEAVIDLSGNTQGLYFVRITTHEKAVVKQVILK